MMNFKYIFATLFLITISFWSCTKTEVASLVVPSTYRYNSPNMYEKTIFAIGLQKNVHVINDTLGTFNRANNEISDSINAILLEDFVQSMIKEVSFLPDNNFELVFGRYDTTNATNTIIETSRVTSKYTLNGNQVQLANFPWYNININNSFLELNFCNEFSLRTGLDKDGNRFRKYYSSTCSSNDPNIVVGRIIQASPDVVYDTISVEFVNLIFSNY